ncbi:MAG: putative ABC transporter permease [Lachnospiraceae bacterium]|nr:putative ABC transporter permease [Lachnospiraceae bacterium]
MEITNKVEIAFLALTFLFMVGSMTGWLIELLFRRFISSNNPDRKWINPGFLVGPCLPLYGFGLTVLFVMPIIPYIGRDYSEGMSAMQVVLTIIAMGVMMTVIEYIAGLIFIKGMKIKLWDYSNEPFNLQGIICLRFSLIWTALTAVYYFFIQPGAIDLVRWFGANIGFTFVVGMFYGILVIDLSYSLNLSAKVRQFAIDNDVVVKYEALKQEIRNDTDRAKKRWRFLLALHTEDPLHKTMREKIERIKAKKA